MAQNTPPRLSGIFEKVPLPLIGGAAALVVIAIIIAGVALSSSGSENGTAVAATPTPRTSTPISGGLQTAMPTPVATADLSAATSDEVEHLTSIGENDRFIIPRFNVDAPMTYRAVGTDGVMPDPEGPDDIAYYDFSAWEGKGGKPALGNAVFSGHVDSGHEACNNGTVPPPCTAVLWDLNNLNLDDEIHVIVDGILYKYAVTSNEPVHAVTGPWDQLVTATAEPSLTIITCGGNFNRETGEYDHRQVVRATFIGEEPAPS